MTTFDRIYDIVRRIPPGRVATYGQIARMLGNPRFSRIVGCAMHSARRTCPVIACSTETGSCATRSRRSAAKLTG